MEAGSEKVKRPEVDKGKGKAKAVPEEEEDKVDKGVVESEKLDTESNLSGPVTLGLRKMLESWLSNPVSDIRYVNDDERLEKLFMTFLQGMASEQRKTREAVERMTPVMEKMSVSSGKMMQVMLNIESMLFELREELKEKKRKREDQESDGVWKRLKRRDFEKKGDRSGEKVEESGEEK